MSKIRLNPGNPVPDLRQTVTRLKELWPLRGVVMKSLENLGLKRGGGAMCDGTSEADIVEIRIGALVMGEEPDTGRKMASPSGHPADLLLACLLACLRACLLACLLVRSLARWLARSFD